MDERDQCTQDESEQQNMLGGIQGWQITGIGTSSSGVSSRRSRSHRIKRHTRGCNKVSAANMAWSRKGLFSAFVQLLMITIIKKRSSMS